MPMLQDPEVVLENFATINSSDRFAVQEFVDLYFAAAGSDVVNWTPSDLKTEPAFIKHVPAEYRAWAADLNSLWGILGRQTATDVSANPQRHSFVPRSSPMIVPGGRFRESYYWDSWWIVRGLLVCDMLDSALYVISNLLDDMENFGFVPNGGRIYYLDRSQPPLLSEMVLSYLEKVGFGSEGAGFDLLQRAFPLLEKEYQWWMNETLGHVVTLPGGYVLNRYTSMEPSPRPESYYEDTETAERLTETNPSATAAPLYRSLRAGAETGWDFSSRWIAGTDKGDLTHINTSTIIPVELNSYLYRMERHLARFGALINTSAATVSSYYAAADRRYEAVERVLWNPDALDGQGLWCDYNLTSLTWEQVDPESLSISQWIPMWAGK
jgi:alpha,alpha-trehalase